MEGSGLRSGPSYDSFTVLPMNGKDRSFPRNFYRTSKNCCRRERAL